MEVGRRGRTNIARIDFGIGKYIKLVRRMTIITDILKVNFFARSEFSLITFCAEIAIKTYKILKNFVKFCQKYEKVTVLQF